MTQTYSRQVLEEAPERVLTFLAGVGTSVLIRMGLARVGYSEKDHEEGWRLLHAATGYQAPVPIPIAEQAVSDAISELDAWDEPNFRLARAALVRRHPDAAAFLFADLDAATGSAAVLSVKTFLDRLDQLDGTLPGRDHKDRAKKAADGAATAALAKRGITPTERGRLRALVAMAEKGAELSKEALQLAKESEKQAEARVLALGELRAWYDEWAETARVVIKRRDQLIRLGLAKRRSGGGNEPNEPSDPTDPSDPKDPSPAKDPKGP